MPTIVHSLVLLVGMAGIYFAYLQFQKTQALLAQGIVTTATVKEVMEEMDDESLMYRPKFEYFDKQQRPVTFEGTMSTGHKVWRVGEKTKVVYQPDIPSSVRIITYWNLYRASILLTAFSLPFLVIGLGYFLYQVSMQDTALT